MRGRAQPVVLALGVLVAVAAGCGGGSKSSSATTTQSSSKQAFCSDVSSFQSSANDLKNVDTNTETLSGLKTSAQSLVADGKAVVSSGKQLASVSKSELQSAFDGLRTSVKNIASSGSVKEGLQGVQESAASASQTWSSLAKNAGCKTSS